MSSLTDEDETTPIANLRRITDGVVDIMDKEKSKMKKQIGKNKDQATSMEGNWAKTRVRKTINGTYAPNIGHPTLAEEVGVKPYSRNYMVHTMLKLEYLMPLLPNPDMYYHRLQVCLRVGVAPQML